MIRCILKLNQTAHKLSQPFFVSRFPCASSISFMVFSLSAVPSEELAENDQEKSKEKAETMSFVIFLCVAGCIIPHLVFSANQSVSFTLKLNQTKFSTISNHFRLRGKPGGGKPKLDYQPLFREMIPRSIPERNKHSRA